MAFNIADNFAKREAETAPKIEMLDIDRIITNNNNFYRVSGDTAIEKQNEQTKASIEMYGILQPLRVAIMPDGKYKIIAGERRYLACKRLVQEGNHKFKILPCIIEKAESAEDEQIKLIITNQHRDLSTAERMQEVKQLSELIKKKKANGEKVSGNMDKAIAEMLNISKSEVGRIQQVNKNLEPELKNAVADNKLSMAAATELSKLPPSEQKNVYEKTGGTIKTADAKKLAQKSKHKKPANINIDGFTPKPDKSANKDILPYIEIPSYDGYVGNQKNENVSFCIGYNENTKNIFSYITIKGKSYMVDLKVIYDYINNCINKGANI
ncbi:ParB/RepB/Spo0J family partition protein [Pectinatus frisingensis]|uniref:ParB/RepB/Spo0J family partition protein n=1 Tax=Pectinatus frisingensis TaxID=865 RepID=UPI0018C6BF0C|nr:ParB N-terminal domain-containing protein [Pectinatus frisingensis]